MDLANINLNDLDLAGNYNFILKAQYSSSNGVDYSANRITSDAFVITIVDPCVNTQLTFGNSCNFL